MLYHINLRTLAGVVLDCDEQIEIVMGGMSFLNLELRNTSYSTTFNLKRTPINDSVLGFASNIKRSTNPAVPVIVTASYFQLKGILRVVSFGGGNYECTIMFSDFNEKIRNLKINEVIDTVTNPLFTESNTNDLGAALSSSIDWSMLYSRGTDEYDPGTGYLLYSKLAEQGIWLGVEKFFELVGENLGYTFLNTNSIDFSNMYIHLSDYEYQVNNATDYTSYTLTYFKHSEDANHLVSDILKSILQIAVAYYNVNENDKTITIWNAKVLGDFDFCEDFNVTTKTIQPFEFETNYINYQYDESLGANYKGGYFDSNGVGISELFQINSTVPKKTLGVYQAVDYYDLRDVTSIVIAKKSAATYIRGYKSTATPPYMFEFKMICYDNYDMDIIQLDYTFLTKYFASPIVLEVEGTISSPLARNMFATKLFKSLKLGGLFWIDSMNYNLSTGKTVSTIIRVK